MSDFVQQQHTICNFSNEESWVILSPIEQSIKQKIESVGTPLKDWDIKIYRRPIYDEDNYLIDALEVDSYYSAFEQPLLVIKEVARNYV